MNECQIIEALNNFITNANVDEDSELFKQAVAAVNELDNYELIDKRDSIAIVWMTDDVLSIRPDLTEDQAMEVLVRVDRKHDASIGVSWETLEIYADDMFPAPDEGEEEDE
jgi:hypothetical protein